MAGQGGGKPPLALSRPAKAREACDRLGCCAEPYLLPPDIFTNRSVIAYRLRLNRPLTKDPPLLTPSAPRDPAGFTVMAIGQAGRLQYEAILLAASLRHSAPHFSGQLIICEPQPGPLWRRDPRMDEAAHAQLRDLGAEILPFESKHFGQSYPYGNKIEALLALPEHPFLFLDTDTLITGDLSTLRPDFSRPSASMRREGTWPQIPLYGPSYDEIWGALYHRFGLDFPSSLDLSQPQDYWQRYLYFNAGWFFYESPSRFGRLFLDYALSIRDDPPEALALQELDPWLDQVALPLVIHALGGARPGPELAGLDGDLTCHWRNLALLYARESDHVIHVLETIAKVQPQRRLLRDFDPIKTMVYRSQGKRARALFDRSALPRREKALRTVLKREGLWLRD